MQVTSPSTAPLTGATLAAPTGPAVSANERNAFEAARKLNDLEIVGREYAVIRDSATQKFVVVVRDDSGAVLDQFPPEEILKMMAQLSAFNPARADSTGVTLA